MNRKLLLVEDDSAIMETLSLLLRYEGYNVLKARGVDEALAVLTSETPHLVLLDYMLQDGTAEPVVDAVRALGEARGYDPVVVLLTAADAPEEKCISVGADAVIAKPFELEALLKMVRKYFDQSPKRAVKVPGASLSTINLS